MKRWLTAAAFVLIGAVILITTGLVLPRVVSWHYIEQSKSADPKISRYSFEQLLWMGRWAVPSLMEAAAERDPELEVARRQPCPDSFSSQEWLDQLRRLRVASPTERHSDCMLVPLLRAWEAGSLRERDKRRLLRYIYQPAISMTWKKYNVDANEIAAKVAVHVDFPLYDRAFKFSRTMKVILAVDGDEQHPAITATGHEWMASGHSTSGPSRPDVNLLRAISLSSSSIGTTHSLDAAALDPGTHTVSARFLIGPAAVKETNTANQAPPWHEEFIARPFEFELGDVVTPVRRDEPELNQTMDAVLDDWTLSVSRDSPGRLRFRSKSGNLALPASLAGELNLSVNRKWGPMRLWNLKAEAVLPDLEVGMPEQIMLNPGRYVVTVTFSASRDIALRCGLASYWAGKHEFGPVSVEVHADGSLAPLETDQE